MRDDRADAHPGDQHRDACAGLPTDNRGAIRYWRWWFRWLAGLVVGLVWLMHDLAPLALFLGGVLFGVVLDRFVLWPLAVIVAKFDGRLRSG